MVLTNADEMLVVPRWALGHQNRLGKVQFFYVTLVINRPQTILYDTMTS